MCLDDSIVNMNILFVKFKRDSYIYIWLYKCSNVIKLYVYCYSGESMYIEFCWIVY